MSHHWHANVGVGWCPCDEGNDAPGAPAECTCLRVWHAVTDPPPCPVHARREAEAAAVAQREAEAILHVLKAMEVQRDLLARILAVSYVGRTDEGPRLYLERDWLDLTQLEAELLQSLES